jgi:hypothetical protein
MPNSIDRFYKGVRIATRVYMSLGRPHEHGRADCEVITVITMISKLRTQRMLIINDARVIDSEYDFSLREIASRKNAQALDLRLCYDYIRHVSSGFVTDCRSRMQIQLYNPFIDHTV